MADPMDTDPADRDPREDALARRSAAPTLSPWLILAGAGLLAAGAFVVSALL
ncbi:hypothetical protein [Brevundimonas sp.]|uniref:hypothetical protein n=1 Tax=Brevundimonas sp. TaxID=1871086 RepID=UPI002ABABF24|nr:hypothetical protein [Brevundimonas sp.]MDZ4364058.1 hypothetical protein [Brevundimonas sp.]